MQLVDVEDIPPQFRHIVGGHARVEEADEPRIGDVEQKDEDLFVAVDIRRLAEGLGGQIEDAAIRIGGGLAVEELAQAVDVALKNRAAFGIPLPVRNEDEDMLSDKAAGGRYQVTIEGRVEIQFGAHLDLGEGLCSLDLSLDSSGSFGIHWGEATS